MHLLGPKTKVEAEGQPVKSFWFFAGACYSGSWGCGWSACGAGVEDHAELCLFGHKAAPSETGQMDQLIGENSLGGGAGAFLTHRMILAS